MVPVGACAFCIGLSGSILWVPGFMDLERALVYLSGHMIISYVLLKESVYMRGQDL